VAGAWPCTSTSQNQAFLLDDIKPKLAVHACNTQSVLQVTKLCPLPWVTAPLPSAAYLHVPSTDQCN
jgi:hypothetical protein